jgi:hypothetical protein
MTEKVPVNSIGKRSGREGFTFSLVLGRLLVGAAQEKDPAKKIKMKM